MSVRKAETGKWACDFYSEGRGSKRIRKSFATCGEALRYERESGDSNFNTIEAEARAARLSELIKDWYELHGRS